MTVEKLSPSTAPLFYTNTAARDLLQIRYHIDLQDYWPDEDDMLVAGMWKYKNLKSPPKEKVDKEDTSSVDDLYISNVAEKYRYRLRETLRSHKSTWSGSMCQINATQRKIELNSGTRQIRQHPYRFGPRLWNKINKNWSHDQTKGDLTLKVRMGLSRRLSTEIGRIDALMHQLETTERGF